MSDREEREKDIEVLKSWDGYFIGYTSDEVQEALRYAIASIETDLRYDLLYEETSGQADKPTTKNEAKYCDRSICLKNEYNNVGCEDCEVTKSQEITTKNNLGVASGLDKNSKKLEKGTTKDNLGVDCISRQAAVKAVMQDVSDKRTRGFNAGVTRAANKIKLLPPVTPQPKTGHWIANAPQYDMFNPQYICSECGNAHTRITPYCEMCGAKMVEPQESEG